MGKPKLGNKNYHQGLYVAKNPNKYMGNIQQIMYRSSWEFRFMFFLDNNPKITKWNSEGIIISYKDLRNKSHRYYPDFYYESVNDKDPNMIDKVIIELKPMKETKQPDKPLKESLKSLKNYEYDLKMYMKNKLKWGAAVEWCQKRGYKFVLITEEHLKKAGIL